MKKQGFTLIELLVVIVIIGLLMGIVIAGIGYSRKKAQDTQSVSDLSAVQAGLQNYYVDKAAYPTSIFNSLFGPGGTLVPPAGNYLEKPITSTATVYNYSSDGLTYRLWFEPKLQDNKDYATCLNCNGSGKNYYLIKNGKTSTIW